MHQLTHFGCHDLERQVNFGHLAVHRTAVNAKAIIKGYFVSDIERSLFFGCSRGEGQGLMLAQRSTVISRLAGKLSRGTPIGSDLPGNPLGWKRWITGGYNPDLSAFRARGGKLIIDFDSSVRDDVRLFLTPGVAHCRGGHIICAHPQVVTYDGSGAPNDPASFSCVKPD